MRSVVFCLAALKRLKTYAALRRDFPLILFFPPFIASEFLTYFGRFWMLGPASIALMFPRWNHPLKSLCLGFVVGTIAVLASLRSGVSTVPQSNEPVSIAVRDSLRFPRVGEARIAVDVVRHSGEKFGALCTAIDLPWRNADHLSPGAQAIIQARFVLLKHSLNPFSYSEGLMRDGIVATCKILLATAPNGSDITFHERIRAALREEIETALGEGERSGLLLSMGFGFHDVLTQRTEDAFKQTGLAHLLVVSGAQITLIFVFVLFGCRAILRFVPYLIRLDGTHLAASLIALALTVGFTWIVGIAGPTLRADLALLFFMATKVAERRAGMLNCILVSATALSIIRPDSLFEPGVEITYAALIGIAVSARTAHASGRLHRFLSAAFFANIATAIVSLCWFGQFSAIGFMLYPVVVPVLAFVSCELGFLAIALHWLRIDAHGYFINFVADVLEWGRDIVVTCADFTFAVWNPVGWQLLAAVLALLSILIVRGVSNFSRYIIASGIDFPCFSLKGAQRTPYG